MTTAEREKLAEVVSKLADERASDDDFRWLSGHLESDAEAKLAFAEMTALEARLQMRLGGDSASPSSRALKRIGSPASAERELRIQPMFVAAFSALVAVIGLFVLFNRPTFVGRVADVASASAETLASDSATPFDLGTRLKTGQVYVVSQEAAKVELFTGGILSFAEGAVFELESPTRVFLRKGNVVAHCGENSEKVTIETPDAEFIDLGTEFAVSASADSGSELHVFDGEVQAGEDRIGAGLALSVSHEGISKLAGIANTLGFDTLRAMLAPSLLKEDFDSTESSDLPKGWTIHQSNLEEPALVKVDQLQPLIPGNDRFLSIAVPSGGDTGAEEYPEAVVSWDYGAAGVVDLTQAHTIEFNLRIDCPPENIRRLEFFGAPTPTEDDRARSWFVRASDYGAGVSELSWLIYSSILKPETRWLVMPMEEAKAYRVIVEIDPVNLRYRTSVSNGKETILTSVSDGSPAKIHPEVGPLGILHWRLQAHGGEEAAFAIDTIRIRNRPISQHAN